MRILVGADTPPNPDSGAAGTVFATNAALRELGHSVDEIWAHDLQHRIRHWNLHYLLELPREYRRVVARRCRVENYDVIQLSQPHAWLAARDHRRRRRPGVFVDRSHGLESMADAALAHWHRKLGVPAARFPRTLLSPALRSRLHRHIDLVVKHADGMLVPATDIRDHLVAHHGADPDRVRVVHHGVPARYLEAPRVPMTSARLLRMLYVGQFSFIKGPALLAEAARKVLAAEAGASLTWVCGRAHHAEVRALFAGALQSRLNLVDWTSQEDLVALYDSHGLHLAHSIYEGAAKSCTEAMARGQVVVASRVGALKDHVLQGVNGFLFEVGDIDGVADATLSMLRDLPRAERIGEQAALTARTLSWRACAEGAVNFYGALLQRYERGKPR